MRSLQTPKHSLFTTRWHSARRVNEAPGAAGNRNEPLFHVTSAHRPLSYECKQKQSLIPPTLASIGYFMNKQQNRHVQRCEASKEVSKFIRMRKSLTAAVLFNKLGTNANKHLYFIVVHCSQLQFVNCFYSFNEWMNEWPIFVYCETTFEVTVWIRLSLWTISIYLSQNKLYCFSHGMIYIRLSASGLIFRGVSMRISPAPLGEENLGLF